MSDDVLKSRLSRGKSLTDLCGAVFLNGINTVAGDIIYKNMITFVSISVSPSNSLSCAVALQTCG